jgi:SAM-dependent methyltransferase
MTILAHWLRFRLPANDGRLTAEHSAGNRSGSRGTTSSAIFASRFLWVPMQLAIPVSDLLPLIPLAARAVVHVGCGRGELAAAYRQLNPKAHLLGIEPDALAASRAAAHMHQVSVTEGEADPLPFDLSFLSTASFTTTSRSTFRTPGQ